MIVFQILAICGILSPILYTVMWILGGFLRPEYSHIQDDVSSLLAVGAPKKLVFDAFLISSSVLLFVFYLGLPWGLNNGQIPIVGPILFIISGFMGVLVALFFPLDAGGEITTYRGKMHLVLVFTSGMLTFAGMVALWFGLAGVTEWSAFATYSLISAIVALVLMIISGIFMKSNYRGLLERLGVSTFMVYYFVLALMVFLTN
ncbi:MAG: DUF998 domain-containing protein [Candidatus Hermodarchaeota archaeon]